MGRKNQVILNLATVLGSGSNPISIITSASFVLVSLLSADSIGSYLKLTIYPLDITTEIASKFNAKIYLAAGERAAAKNFGISKSTGDFLFFIDSDMILQPAVISECISICSYDCKVSGVIIPERSIGSSFWVRVRDFERSLYRGSKIESARFFRKSFVVEVGGFDEDIMFYEESTLHQKLEMRGLTVKKRTDSLILHDEEEFDLTKWLSKKQYYSTNAALYRSKYRNYAEIQTKNLS